MRKILLTLALSCSFATGAIAKKIPPASDDEKKAASTAYYACLVDQARALDDGVSDPMSVGAALAPNCNREFDDSVEVYSRGERPGFDYRFARQLRAEQAKDGAAAVLSVRRHRANERSGD